MSETVNCLWIALETKNGPLEASSGPEGYLGGTLRKCALRRRNHTSRYRLSEATRGL
jgi:hypothetical protein